MLRPDFEKPVKTNLVFCSIGAANPVSNLFEGHRDYDVAFHNYGPIDTPRTQQAEYHWNVLGEKLNVAATLLPGILDGYKQVALLDDDLSLTTDDLNRLFQVGEALRLPLYQPALTRGSFFSHPHTVEVEGGVIRKVPFVEIMACFFSRSALLDCMPTFDINESGWGLDVFLWPRAVGGECFVVDKIPIGHYRQPGRRDRVLRNGLTAPQEFWIQQVIDNPHTSPFLPPR